MMDAYSNFVIGELMSRGITEEIAEKMVDAHPDAIIRGCAVGISTIQATANHIEDRGITRNDTHDGIPMP